MHRCTAEAKVQQRYRGAVEVRQERYNVQLRCRSRGGAEVQRCICRYKYAEVLRLL